MFKKTRRRIFMLIVGIATVIITMMLCIIYLVNSEDSFERSIALLESYMNESLYGMPPDKGMPPERIDFRQDSREKHDKMFKLSTFYSVIYDENEEVIKINCNDESLYSEKEILEITDSIIQKGRERGKYNKMPYIVSSMNGRTVVAVIDNTMEVDNFNRLFKICFIVGSATWLIVLMLAHIFSKKIVYPLEQNDSKQKQFISDAGHELKTPISVISANADILALEIGDNKWLSNIRYENERMGNLVKQLLDLARVENMPQTKEHIDFSRLVSGGTLPFESVAFEKGHTLDINIQDNIFVEGNQNQLSQLVSILIDNAIEHSSAQGHINIKLVAAKNNAILSVINPGNIISNDVKARLFERFYREDEARIDDNGHYGLGLAIAKAIVTSHNGKIDVECYDGMVEFSCIIPKTN